MSANPAGDLGRKDVLIVDDEEPIRTMVATVLGRLQLTCDTAPDGLAALGQLEETAYAVVLVDLMMPKLDGVGFVSRLRQWQAENFERPIVIVMTAFPDAADLRNHGDVVQAVFTKPFDINELGELVTGCVSSRRHQNGFAAP